MDIGNYSHRSAQTKEWFKGQVSVKRVTEVRGLVRRGCRSESVNAPLVQIRDESDSQLVTNTLACDQQ